MLCAAYIKVYRHPVFLFLRVYELLGVMRVDEPQVVPAGAGPLWHGVDLSLCRAAALRACGVDPVGDLCKRGLAGAGGQVACHLWQCQRQVFLGKRYIAAVRTVHNRNRLAPVPLAGEDPVPQLIVDGLMAAFVLFKELQHLVDGILLVKSVQPLGVHMDSILGPCLGLHIYRRFENLDDRQIELLGKFPVTVVVGWNCHDGTGSIRDEYIVGNPDRDAVAIHRVDGIASGEHTGLVLCQVGPLQV